MAAVGQIPTPAGRPGSTLLSVLRAYILLYAVGPSFLVPGAVMTIAGGLAFGALWGALWSLVGAELGALIAFGAGRFLGRGFVERIVGARFHHLRERLARANDSFDE